VTVSAAAPPPAEHPTSQHRDEQRRDQPEAAAPVRAERAGATQPVFSLDQPVAARAAAASAPPAAQHVAADPTELRQVVVQHARLVQSPGHDEFTVAVKHPEAGDVSIRIVRDADGVQVSLQTGHAGLRRELQEQLPQLREALGQHGLSLDSFELGSQAQSGHDGSRGQSHAAGRSGGALAPEAESPEAPVVEERPSRNERGLTVWA
ncbi:MAG: flagellar hook-length control protein FliK, partial [Armatimonadetes bacterium]|nr:flagellar hook-length control protein FliK [Armatimonadota bacterium]